MNTTRKCNGKKGFSQGVGEQVGVQRYTAEEGRSKGRVGGSSAVRHVSMLRSRWALEKSVLFMYLFVFAAVGCRWPVTVRKLTEVESRSMSSRRIGRGS
jgi:hypothetical protein